MFANCFVTELWSTNNAPFYIKQCFFSNFVEVLINFILFYVHFKGHGFLKSRGFPTQLTLNPPLDQL